MRILSLLSSATEIVHSLGCGDWLVGRSHECDYPPEVASLPFCTKPKFNIDGTSIEIDKRVKSILQKALSVYYVDEKKLRDLKPDIIITQTQCEVCAVSLKDVQDSLDLVNDNKPKIISIEPNCLDDIWNSIKKISSVLGVRDSGNALVGKMRFSLKKLNQKIQNFDTKSVACIEWIEPLMSAGNWVPELVEKAGGVNLFGVSGKHSPWMDPKELCSADPEIIIIMPCGYNIKKSDQEMGALLKIPGWKNLSAVKKGRIYIADGNQYFNRPGPRLIESLEILIEIIHSGRISFGHEGKGWKRHNL